MESGFGPQPVTQLVEAQQLHVYTCLPFNFILYLARFDRQFAQHAGCTAPLPTQARVLVDGADVVVQGAKVAADGALIANQVDVSQRVNNEPGFDGRLQGLITSLPSSSYFEVEGQPVAVDAHTKLHLKTPLALDVAVDVTGTFDANGVLVASKVKSSK